MITRHCSALSFMGSACLLVGCAPKSPIVPVSAPDFVGSSRAVSVSPAVLTVQSHPLYKQAESACTAKDTAHAVSLLQQLAQTSSLEPEGRAFCLQQIQLLTQPKSRVAIKSVPVTASATQAADCGPRALSLALHSLNTSVSSATLSEWAKTDAKGTSMAGLKRAAVKAGISAEGLQISREGLEDLHVPAIAWKNGSHYVAVLETRGTGENWQAVIHDPNEQNPRTLEREEFLQMCGGYVLTLRR